MARPQHPPWSRPCAGRPIFIAGRARNELPGDLAGGFYVGVAREYLNSRNDAFGEFKKLSLPFRCRPARTII
jgi:hypothetical protein